MKHTPRGTLLRCTFAATLLLLPFGCDKKEEVKEAPSGAAPLAASAAPEPPKPAKPPLKIAFSDWPGWTAFEIGIQKGWFKEAGVDTDFEWFE